MVTIGLMGGIILALVGHFWLFRNKPNKKRLIYSIFMFIIGLILPILSIFIAIALNGM